MSRVVTVKVGTGKVGPNCGGESRKTPESVYLNDDEELDQSVLFDPGDIGERFRGVQISGVRILPGWSFNGGAFPQAERGYLEVSTGIVPGIVAIIPASQVRYVTFTAFASVPNDCFGAGNWAEGTAEVHLKKRP